VLIRIFPVVIVNRLFCFSAVLFWGTKRSQLVLLHRHRNMDSTVGRKQLFRGSNCPVCSNQFTTLGYLQKHLQLSPFAIFHRVLFHRHHLSCLHYSHQLRLHSLPIETVFSLHSRLYLLKDQVIVIGKSDLSAKIKKPRSSTY